MPCPVKRARLTASKKFQRLFPLEYEEGVWGKISVNQNWRSNTAPRSNVLEALEWRAQCLCTLGVNNSREKVNEREQT